MRKCPIILIVGHGCQRPVNIARRPVQAFSVVYDRSRTLFIGREKIVAGTVYQLDSVEAEVRRVVGESAEPISPSTVKIAFDVLWALRDKYPAPEVSRYAVRLDRLRQLEECKSLLKPLDSQGLLADAPLTSKTFHPVDQM